MKKEAIKKQFGLCVRQQRLGLGISQEELADRAGLHRTYVGDVERGNRNVSMVNVVRLANALGLTPSALLEPFSARRPKKVGGKYDN